jgi:hypothetical protein
MYVLKYGRGEVVVVGWWVRTELSREEWGDLAW